MNYLEYFNGTHSNSIKILYEKHRKILMKLNALRANKTPRLRLIVFPTNQNTPTTLRKYFD